MAEYSVYFGKHLETVRDDIAVLQLPMKYTNIVRSKIEIAQSEIEHMAYVYPRPITLGLLPSLNIATSPLLHSYASLDAQTKIVQTVGNQWAKQTGAESQLSLSHEIGNQWAKQTGVDTQVNIASDISNQWQEVVVPDESRTVTYSFIETVSMDNAVTTESVLTLHCSCDVEQSETATEENA